MKNINIAIAGLGTVGSNLINYINKNKKFIFSKSGIDFNIIAISALNKNKKRLFDITEYIWEDNPIDLLNHKIDVLIELIGEEKGISFELIKSALNKKIHVITANKALLAKEGNELFVLANKNKIMLLFEAAVAGGIPIIKILHQSINLHKISKISGILNGTTNYILSEMNNKNIEFKDALKEAQNLGFAELNPKNDIEGIDSAHKLTLLCVLCFGSTFNFNFINYRGISNLSVQDLKFANKLGYKIKLISKAEKFQDKILATVEPMLIKNDSKLANVNGVFNGIEIVTDQLETLFLEGEGAGGIPTASSIISDLTMIADLKNNDLQTIDINKLNHYDFLDYNNQNSSFYLKFIVKDIPGVLAKITTTFNFKDISIETILQLPDTESEDNNVPVIITTHETNYKFLSSCIKELEKSDFLVSKVVILMISKN
ncbi:MAG: Homoserine dehydrogenase [Alphaproteobacteria bacterium MarineAlpha5_Bin9]|nr:MAG: Homoserine dehydrogenase [Alphaproteobacteria bacterium MarineAlpha5_Bin9]|tara:strand:- start:5569 stop:6861 length:1293 start_codon:yes stop_codon:yes gene_type:complete